MKKLLSLVSALIILGTYFTAAANTDGELPVVPIPTKASDSSRDDSGGSGETEPETTAAAAQRISVSSCSIKGVKKKTYTGKGIKQSVTVKYGKTVLKKNTDYKLSYKNNKKIGTATVTVKGIGKYKGAVKKKFKIVPKGTSLKKVNKGRKAFTAKWKKRSSNITGYQLQYSKSKSFKKAKYKTIKKKSISKKTVKKLKAKKTYYVRIRTYKTVKGKKYYSKWSKPKSVKTKK